MNPRIQLRRVPILTGLTIGLVFGAALTAVSAQKPATSAPREGQKPLPMKPDAAGQARNHRLILKDGTYQLVRQYNMAGDRVRYLSLERGDWEEMPADLVDWDATAKWERDHSVPFDQSPGMKEAEAVDKEASEERELLKAQMPEVAPGLELPNQDSVFALDTFEGTPALVELLPTELDIANKAHKGLKTLNPLATQKLDMQLLGAHAKVHLHVNEPVLFVSLGVVDDKESVLSRPMTIDTKRANAVNPKRGAHSDKSGFALIRMDGRRGLRLVGAINVSVTGNVTQDENVVPTKIEVMEGKHWLRIQPLEKLTIGEYAIVEIISPSEINQSVWDFTVNPATPDNPGSIGPLLKQSRR
jgi:hypothetical protein